jgi:hypothetical protein
MRRRRFADQTVPEDQDAPGCRLQLRRAISRQAARNALANLRRERQLQGIAKAMPMTPAEFGKLIADETAKWAKVIRAANIKAE